MQHLVLFSPDLSSNSEVSFFPPFSALFPLLSKTDFRSRKFCFVYTCLEKFRTALYIKKEITVNSRALQRQHTGFSIKRPGRTDRLSKAWLHVVSSWRMKLSPFKEPKFLFCARDRKSCCSKATFPDCTKSSLSD